MFCKIKGFWFVHVVMCRCTKRTAQHGLCEQGLQRKENCMGLVVAGVAKVMVMVMGKSVETLDVG